MIELPFQMIFDLDFSDKNPKEDLLSELKKLFFNISPKPQIKLIFRELNESLYVFINDILKYLNPNISAVDPVVNNLLLDLMEKNIINIKITDNKYDLSRLGKYTYNLMLSFRGKLFEYIKSVNNLNINKITILHNKDHILYLDFKNQLQSISQDDEISKKCYLLPYLEEYEQEAFYSTGIIRPFLTCATPWINPIINSEGKINFPCYCSKNSLIESDFFEIWDSDNLNHLRNNLVKVKQFDRCKYCGKFYEENFLVVEDGVFEYKNKKIIFDNILNPIKSAPTIGIISDKDVCRPIPIYSEAELQKTYSSNILLFILK